MTVFFDVIEVEYRMWCMLQAGSYSGQLSNASQTSYVSGGSLSENRLLRPTPVKPTDFVSPPQPARSSSSTTLASAHNEQASNIDFWIQTL